VPDIPDQFNRPVAERRLPGPGLAVTAIVSALTSAALMAVGFLSVDVEFSSGIEMLLRFLMRVALFLGAYGMIAGIISWLRRPKGRWQIIAVVVAVLYGTAFVLVFTYHE
jgi:hypothetical protein